MRRNPFIAAVVGFVCGIASTQILLIGWWNLVFWGVVGVTLGFFTHEKKEMLWSGALYGFVLTFSFLLSGFHGTSDKLPGFIVFSFFLSVFGIAGGLLTVFIGSKLKH